MPSPLPGTVSPYCVRSGDGEHHAFGGQLATVVARPIDTNGRLEVVIVSGGRGAAFPAHRHAAGHEALLVLDGRLNLVLGSDTYALAPGDYASIPPGITHAYQMRGHYSRLLQWTVGGASAALYTAVGTPTDAIAHDDRASQTVDVSRLASANADTEIVAGGSTTRVAGATVSRSPDQSVPYVLAAGDGERLLAGDQLFTFLSDQRNTNGAFITLSTIGPAGDRIPRHFHKEHTETFVCTHGAMTMWADERELTLHPGDFLHVPAGTVHSYRLDRPYTQFVGLLSPGLFEPFFRAMCEPYEGHIFPAVPGPVRFDRVMQRLHELDLVLVDPPARPPGH